MLTFLVLHKVSAKETAFDGNNSKNPRPVLFIPLFGEAKICSPTRWNAYVVLKSCLCFIGVNALDIL